MVTSDAVSERKCSCCGKSPPEITFLKRGQQCNICVAAKRRAWRAKRNPNYKSRKNRAAGLLGLCFGNLIVVERFGTDQWGDNCWKCQCTCGNKVILPSRSMIEGNTKSCGCLKRRTRQVHPAWRGHGNISGSFWKQVLHAAELRDYEVSLTIEEAWTLFEQQKGQCALSGLKIDFPESSRERGTASLDRIDSTKPYTLSNVQWVHKSVNLMKGQLDQKQFVKLCQCVVNRSLNETSQEVPLDRK